MFYPISFSSFKLLMGHFLHLGTNLHTLFKHEKDYLIYTQTEPHIYLQLFDNSCSFIQCGPINSAEREANEVLQIHTHTHTTHTHTHTHTTHTHTHTHTEG